jgi:hypothetical protein
VIHVSFSLIWNVVARVSESGAIAPGAVRPLAQPIELSPSIGCPPAMPY